MTIEGVSIKSSSQNWVHDVSPKKIDSPVSAAPISASSIKRDCGDKKEDQMDSSKLVVL